MKRAILALALLGAGTAASAATDVKRVGDFSLLDQQGYFHQMSYYDDHKAVALLVQSSGRPVSDKDLAAFNEARAKYQDKIKFFMIDPVADETRASVQQELDKHGVDIPVLMDETQLVAEGLGVSKIGEVFLIRPGTTDVLYRGPVNKYFVRAIDDVLAGREVKKAKVSARGAAVKYVAAADRTHRKSTISYSKDVAPILAENCARCHREGGIAPFAMNSHAIVQGFAPMIREVVLTKRMPPGQIDPHVGDFKETFALSAAGAADADPLDRSGRAEGRRRRIR